jgi:hypothetical protein
MMPGFEKFILRSSLTDHSMISKNAIKRFTQGLFFKAFSTNHYGLAT